MSTVVLDADLRARLQGAGNQLEITDESGTVVGHYLTHEEYLRLRYAEAKAQISDAEIEEARRDVRENGGLTTAQVLDRLRELDGRLREGR